VLAVTWKIRLLDNLQPAHAVGCSSNMVITSRCEASRPRVCRYLGEDMETPTAAGADASSTAEQYAAAEELPTERLAFALGDGTGRIGVLAVQGRKVGLQSSASDQ
jgi:hypothetical protein